MLQEAHRGVTLTARLTSEDPLWCSGSASRLLRVISNLVGNAIESVLGKGEVTVTASGKVLTAPYHGYETVPAGEYSVIEVTDTGCGMDDKTKTKVFEPFFSLKAPSQRAGSGLGLSVVHGLISDHRGFIDLKSQLGQGTTFTVYLPRSEAGVTEEKPKVAKMPQGDAQILVIDDEPAQRFLARRFLERLGYTATLTSSGVEAVALFKAIKRKKEESPFDLIMVDMVMKEMDGLATIKSIRNLYPNQKFIVVSGHATDEATIETHGLGIAWLSKPYSLTELAQILKAQL